MDYDNSIKLIITDIQHAYVSHRESGKSRKETIELLLEEYEGELNDDDERVAVLIGVSLSLCKKKELYDSIAKLTLSEIQSAINDKTLYGISEKYALNVIKRLTDPSVYGDEAVYKRKAQYIPDWEIGDTFSHELTCPYAEKLGIKGWMILLYKVGEYTDGFCVHKQLMYVSVCPPNKVPTCSQELQNLGFLPMFYTGEQREYLTQITIKSRKGENAYKLTKVGCFPDIELPEDRAIENPLTSMPLSCFIRKGESFNVYEEQVCGFYRRYLKNHKNT